MSTRVSLRLQDDGAPEPLERRKSSFTQLMGQASVLHDMFRRCQSSFTGCAVALQDTALALWVEQMSFVMEFVCAQSKEVLYRGLWHATHTTILATGQAQPSAEQS